MLVGARLVQGLAAALLSPQVLSIIGVVYDGPDRVRAISIYGIVLGLAAVGGQLIGGVLVQADIAGLGWRSCFLINVPIGLVAPGASPRAPCPSRAPRAPAGSTSWAPRWSRSGSSTSSCRSSRAASTAGRRGRGCASAPPRSRSAVFAAHQRRLSRRGGAPLLDPALFRERAFSAGLVTQLVFFSSMASYFLVLALYLQQGRGLDALQAGLVFTILAAAYLVASAYAPGLTPRLGPPAAGHRRARPGRRARAAGR